MVRRVVKRVVKRYIKAYLKAKHLLSLLMCGNTFSMTEIEVTKGFGNFSNMTT